MSGVYLGKNYLPHPVEYCHHADHNVARVDARGDAGERADAREQLVWVDKGGD